MTEFASTWLTKLPIVFGAVFAVPALAQWSTETGSHISTPAPAEIPETRMSEADRARSTIASFGQCVVLGHRPAVESAIAGPPLDKRSWQKIRDLATSDCLRNGQLTMTTSLIRGALYQSLYRADFAKSQPAFLSTPIDFWADVGGISTDPAAQSYVAIRQLGDCVVRQDQMHSRDYVLSYVGGRSETEALSALASEIGSCVQSGTKLALSKIVLTGALAEALYRESQAARSAIASNGNP